MNAGLVLCLSLPDCRYEADRIVQECDKEGISVDVKFYEDITITFHDDGLQFFYQGKPWDLHGYKWCYTRPSHYRNYGGFSDLKTLVMMELSSYETHIINGNSFLQWQHFSKIVQYYLFNKANLPLIPSRHIAVMKDGVEDMPLPLILKKGVSSMGQGVTMVKTTEDLQAFSKSQSFGDILIQDYISIQEDYRILVVANQAIGGIKRKLAPDSFLTNISAGGSGEALSLNEPLKALAEKVAKVCNLEHCGVDVLTDAKGNYRILEVNRLPQLQGFEKVTGVNVARKIVEFLTDEKQ